ncbi:hypothetical protein D3C79_714880 [compost metagenome]
MIRLGLSLCLPCVLPAVLDQGSLQTFQPFKRLSDPLDELGTACRFDVHAFRQDGTPVLTSVMTSQFNSVVDCNQAVTCSSQRELCDVHQLIPQAGKVVGVQVDQGSVSGGGSHLVCLSLDDDLFII